MCPDTNSPEDSGRSYKKQPSELRNQNSDNRGPGAPTPHVCPLNRSCRAECRAWQTGSLDGALRYFAEYHDWHESGYLANQLKILLVFKKPVRAAANKLLAVGLDGLAAQIKKEFKRLLEMCQPLDGVRGRLIVEEDEAMKLEHTRAYLTESLIELAELVESGNKPRKPQKNIDIPPADDGQWITLTEAAEMIGKHPGTISYWVRIGKVTDNGKKRYQRRVLKADIALIKQDVEEKDLQKDMRGLRRDAKRIR